MDTVRAGFAVNHQPLENLGRAQCKAQKVLDVAVGHALVGCQIAERGDVALFWPLTADIIALASQLGRHGFRRITALLREAGWAVNVKRVDRIWRREGPKVLQKQPKKVRLWLNDGSCIRLWPERQNKVWSCDFAELQTHEGSSFRMLRFIDESSRWCLAMRIDRGLRSTDVIKVLSALLHKPDEGFIS